MSSLLRVSRILGRQRGLLQPANPSISANRRKLSATSWAPPAYRSARPSNKPSLRGKRRSPKKMERGRDGLWKALQQVYGEPSTTTGENNDITPTTKNKDDWKVKRLHRREVKLLQAQEEFRSLLHSYQNALFPDNSRRKSRKGPIARLLKSLHDLCTNALQDKGTLVVSMETIDQTEDQFRDLGKLTQKVLSRVVRMPEEGNTVDDQDDNEDKAKNSVLAEDLLRGMIQLKEDRALLVQRAEEALKQQKEASEQQDGSLMGWFKKVFLFSSGDEEQEQQESSSEKEPIPLRAHEEESFGPSKMQYAQVFRSIRRDAYAFAWEPTPDMFFKSRVESKEARDGLLECANRMTTLLNLHLQHGGNPTTSLSLPAMECYAQVGSLQAAQEANRIYSEVHAKKVPRFVFHSLLKAYRLAALMEAKPEARAEAAMTAIALLKEREEYSLATSYFSAPVEKDPRGESYILVLETLELAGEKAIPDRIQQAETLLKLFLGEKAFKQVVYYRNELPTSGVDLQIFESLLLMYSAKVVLLKKAKNILNCAHDQQAATASSRRASNDGEEGRVFPNTRSYNSVLQGIQMKVKGILSEHQAPSIAQYEAKEATALLDHMTQSPCCPNLQTFELLAEIWALVESPESGQRVEEILSRMSLQKACTGRRDGWSDSCRVYSHLLHCWAKGPEASSSAALHRALRILDKMEANSGLRFMPGSDAPQEEKDIFHSVYEQNEPESYRAAYNGALLICSLCRDDSEEAFQTAFDIYNRMIAAGITPDENTYRNLFAACLLPGGDDDAMDRRRELASTVIAFASDHGMKTTEMNKQMARMFYKRKRTNKV